MTEPEVLRALHSSDMRQWVSALEDAVSVDFSDETVAQVVALSTHHDLTVREAAVYCLTNKPDPRAIDTLIAVVRADDQGDNPYQSISYYALCCLEDLQDPAVLQFYRELISNEGTSPFFHDSIARGLGIYDNEVAVEALLLLSAKDDNFRTQQWVAESLLKLNRPRLAAHWAEVAHFRRDPVVKGIARQALRQLRSKILYPRRGKPLQRLRSRPLRDRIRHRGKGVEKPNGSAT